MEDQSNKSDSSRVSDSWITNVGFYDPSYYKSALNTTNIYKFDYHLARVFNTPDYCNLLLQDLHGQIETYPLKKMPEIKTKVSGCTVYKSAINELVENICAEIEISITNEKDAVLAKKGLAWFLITTSLLSEIDLSTLDDNLLGYVNELQDMLSSSNSVILFQDLIQLCGTRFAAEKSRTLIKSIVSSIT